MQGSAVIPFGCTANLQKVRVVATGNCTPSSEPSAVCRLSSRVQFFGLIVLAVLSHGVAASDAVPGLKIIDHVEHYIVTGYTALSIRKQLASRSEAGGAPRHGSTLSTFEVISKLEEVDGLCRVLQQEIVVEITIELPQWEPRRKVNSALQKQWDESVARLNRHEAGHRRNVLQAATALRQSLAELVPQERCITARAGMDIELESALKRLDRREAYYDRLTRDGLRDLPGTADSPQIGDVDKQGSRAKDRLPKASRKLPVE